MIALRCASTTTRSENCITCTVRVRCACIAQNTSPRKKGYIWKHSASCNLLATKRNGERRRGRVRGCAACVYARPVLRMWGCMRVRALLCVVTRCYACVDACMRVRVCCLECTRGALASTFRHPSKTARNAGRVKNPTQRGGAGPCVCARREGVQECVHALYV